MSKDKCTHGQARRSGKTSEYLIWVSMRQRCLNPNNKQYSRYGGRGITVCKEWDNFQTFLKEMGGRPSKSHSLDRIDNNKGYDAENCRWATQSEQTRNTSRNVIVSVFGEKMSLIEAIERFGGRYGTVLYRIKTGMSAEDALNIRGAA